MKCPRCNGKGYFPEAQYRESWHEASGETRSRKYTGDINRECYLCDTTGAVIYLYTIVEPGFYYDCLYCDMIEYQEVVIGKHPSGVAITKKIPLVCRVCKGSKKLWQKEDISEYYLPDYSYYDSKGNKIGSRTPNKNARPQGIDAKSVTKPNVRIVRSSRDPALKNTGCLVLLLPWIAISLCCFFTFF